MFLVCFSSISSFLRSRGNMVDTTLIYKKMNLFSSNLKKILKFTKFPTCSILDQKLHYDTFWSKLLKGIFVFWILGKFGFLIKFWILIICWIFQFWSTFKKKFVWQVALINFLIIKQNRNCHMFLTLILICSSSVRLFRFDSSVR